MLIYILSAASILCLLAIWVLFLQVRRYLNTHEDEEMSVARKYLMPRITAITILTVAAAVFSIIRVFLR